MRRSLRFDPSAALQLFLIGGSETGARPDGGADGASLDPTYRNFNQFHPRLYSSNKGLNAREKFISSPSSQLNRRDT